MSNFTPLVTEEFEFEGDKVIVEFARLKRKDMLASMPALKKLADAQTNKDAEAEALAINDVLNGIVDVIPNYVTKMEGLTDANGNVIDIQTVCDEFYFMKLAAAISTSMMVASSGKEGKV